ncbi:hypothetical protein TNCT_632801 [Trichonephila clavata]|uniref:Uncharacterized protein n=1 Tax=Trichonephila clavata TaxID=2740835 RepID=A0A8X6M2D9_TRICU|nr:hypothetical protein TNCT_632801 [Trichonephila clavata]
MYFLDPVIIALYFSSAFATVAGCLFFKDPHDASLLSQVIRSEKSQFFYRYTWQKHKDWKISAPEKTINIKSCLIARFPHLPFAIMSKLYFTISTHFLYKKGILSEKNTQSVTNTLAEMMENIVQNNDRDFNFKAIEHGFIIFLSSFIQFTPKKGWKITVTYGNCWRSKIANAHFPWRNQ